MLGDNLENHVEKVEEEHERFETTILADKKRREFKQVFNGVSLNITVNQAAELEKLPYVKSVKPNKIYSVSLYDANPEVYAEQTWIYQEAGENITGKDITIAIIDTGIDYNHPDLGGCLGQGCKIEGGYDFVNNDADPMDDHGHGTHVAGIAAGNGDLKGVAPDAKLYAYKVLSAEGYGSEAVIISAIERAADPNQDGDFSDKLDIISLSLGGPGNPDGPMSQAINNAVKGGVVVVVAAGNAGPVLETIGSPGNARKAITVGATYKKNYNALLWDKNPRIDEVTSFSSRGPVYWTDEHKIKRSLVKPDIVAPGAVICAALAKNNTFNTEFNLDTNPVYHYCKDKIHLQIAGTSMATPIVSGSVAIIKQTHPTWKIGRASCRERV